ncbi:MAG: conjugal transfer protein, partial [Gammaproteobacteria bacterium HGW-Gammaproteobacteria-7]
SAAAYYTVPVDLVRAVLLTEGGASGTVSRNTNGTRDLGPMQINSIHLPELANYGITESALVRDECLNIHVGAFLLRRALDAEPAFWRGVGRYHSATPTFNRAYQLRVWRNLVRLQSPH